jgi:hypothetical protein
MVSQRVHERVLNYTYIYIYIKVLNYGSYSRCITSVFRHSSVIYVKSPFGCGEETKVRLNSLKMASMDAKMCHSKNQ